MLVRGLLNGGAYIGTLGLGLMATVDTGALAAVNNPWVQGGAVGGLVLSVLVLIRTGQKKVSETALKEATDACERILNRVCDRYDRHEQARRDEASAFRDTLSELRRCVDRLRENCERRVDAATRNE